MQLSKLIKLPLRTIWKHEAQDFTKWLAAEENLALLSETIGITLANPQTEVGVGKFNVDILADDEDNNRKVIIENQIEKTNHDHLGKLITYASGLNAELCIWIVAKAQEEHEQAIQWLNENTTENANFFLIEIEAWQIGESLPAAKFNIVTKPNDWAKIIKQSGRGDNKVTDFRLQQKDFWDKVREYGEENCQYIRSWRNARPQQWHDIAIGLTQAHLRATVNSRETCVVMDFYIPKDTSLFRTLEAKRSDIENELGYALEWRELPEKKASSMGVKQSGDFQDESQQDELAKWIVDKAEDFARVFRKYL